MLHRYYFTITSKLHLKTLSTLFKRSFVKILRRKKEAEKTAANDTSIPRDIGTNHPFCALLPPGSHENL